MRQVVLDTETTGIGHELGHRIIEIGCVELLSRKLTGRRFHTYLNPERAVDDGAFRVHGLNNAFLQDKPLFKEISEPFIEFIRDSELIIHNASFDIGFLNAELKLINHPTSIDSYCPSVCDTLSLAREKYPGQRNNLDALCKRHNIDNSNRTLHGALLDAKILALVYLAMTSGQTTLFDNNIELVTDKKKSTTHTIKALKSNSPVVFATEEELNNHNEFIHFLRTKKK